MTPAETLTDTIDALAHLLPAQGPISIFIHHNTLHALEDQRFEDAVVRAGQRLGTEPFLPEARYRDKLASGRIRAADVETLLGEQLGPRGGEDVAGTGPRFDLWRAVALHGIPEAAGRELAWILDETDALAGKRTLWNACLAAVARADAPPPAAEPAPVRHRDWLNAVHGVDVDAWFHPPLIRFLAGYLDQGLAQWSIPGRSHGIHGCFLDLYSTGLSAQCGDWARTLPRLAAEDRDAGRHALDSIAHSLDVLNVAADEWPAYLGAELLALRGWAGIVRQIEERPDRVPARDIIVTLRGYLAVRLLFERAALDAAARQVGFTGALAEWRPALRRAFAPAPAPTAADRAWPLFHVAQLRGLDPSRIERWTAGHVADLESELREIDGFARRRVLHQSFERTIRYRLYDALIRHAPRAATGPPAFQAIFCLDEREESIRRHLEEVEPGCETFGAAGFFNVAMYHQGATDAHPRPLCPVAIRPDHYVGEIEAGADRLSGRSRRFGRRAAGFLGYNVHLGSRRAVRGALLMTLFGWLSLVPLILRVVFP